MIRRRWRQILHLHDSPNNIAWGVVLGNIIGWLPIMGIQMPVAALFAWICRVNIVAALALVWLSNPATFLAIYYANYRVGSLLLGGSITREEMKAIWDQIWSMPLWQGIQHFMVESFERLFLPMAIGGLIIGVLTSIPLYFIALRAIRRIQRQHYAQRLHWAGRLAAPPSPTPGTPDDEPSSPTRVVTARRRRRPQPEHRP